MEHFNKENDINRTSEQKPENCGYADDGAETPVNNHEALLDEVLVPSSGELSAAGRDISSESDPPLDSPKENLVSEDISSAGRDFGFDPPLPDSEPLLGMTLSIEEEAQAAAEAAQRAYFAAQSAILTAGSENAGDIPGHDQKAQQLRGRLEAAKQTLYASEASVQAQKAATELASSALRKAREEASRCRDSEQDVVTETERLAKLQKSTAEALADAREEAVAASQKAKLEEEKHLAARAAALASQTLREEAAFLSTKAGEQMQKAESVYQNAKSKLAKLEIQGADTKEQVRLVLTEIEREGLEIPDEDETAFAALRRGNSGDALKEKTAKEAVKEEKGGKNIGLAILDFVKIFVVALGIALLLRAYVFQFSAVDGESMLPTMHNNDFVITSKIGYYFSPPDRGDIVVLSAPDVNNKYYIKRIIGLPGETIEIRNGAIYINGATVPLNEPYLDLDTTPGVLIKRIPENHYFVMGDNRSHSHDSRSSSVGAIPRSSIIGKAVFRLWPFSNFGGIY